MFGQGDGLPFSRHSDVLNATPSDNDSLVRLVEELKRRGNAAFASKSYEEAEVLYSRAIDINTADPLKNQHIFFANRSASRCSMGKNALALDDANACIALDSQYAKGYFRKAQALKALKQYKEALAVVDTAKSLDPQNKSLSTLQSQLQDLAMKQVDAPVAPKVEKKVTRIEVVKDGDSASTSSKSVVDVSAVDGEEGLGNVRGYKKLADGRVTTFFNNELTEEAKRLIGDIAPKKVNDSNAVQIKNVEGGSAWNVGNTFEEKDMTSWATTKIPSLLSGLSVPLGTAAGTITVKDVKDVSGEASIAVFRGKKRYIFGYSFIVSLTAHLNDGVSIDGELKFLDMSSDSDGDYEVDVNVPSRYQNISGKAVHSALSSPTSPIRAALTTQLNNFVVEFHNQ